MATHDKGRKCSFVVPFFVMLEAKTRSLPLISCYFGPSPMQRVPFRGGSWPFSACGLQPAATAQRSGAMEGQFRGKRVRISSAKITDSSGRINVELAALVCGSIGSQIGRNMSNRQNSAVLHLIYGYGCSCKVWTDAPFDDLLALVTTRTGGLVEMGLGNHLGSGRRRARP